MIVNRWGRGLGLVGLLAGLALGVGVLAGAAMPTAPAANAGWEEIGAGSASGGGISEYAFMSRNPALTVGPSGPLVAWWDERIEGEGDSDIYVRRWDGSAWVKLDGSVLGGDINANTADSFVPSIAVGPDNAPIVVWEDQNVGEIYAHHWDGSAWVKMDGSGADGGISASPGQSLGPQVAITSSGPIIVWHDNSQGNWEIYVRRWDGAAWVEMGAGSASGGGISNNSGGSSDPVVAVAPDGTPFVAWSDNTNASFSYVYLRRWNGSTWVEVGDSASGSGVSQNGASWAPALTIGLDGAPIVAFSVGLIDYTDIHARRWNGADWEEMGDPAEGISNNAGESWFPELAISQAGIPIVAWMDDSSGQFEIYVRRWNGSAWIEFGDSSAAAGGISDTPDYSGEPSLAIDADGRAIVAWYQFNSQLFDDNIYVRRSPALTTHRSFIPSILYQPPTCFPGPNEQEPNNTQAEANGPLCHGQTYHGRPTDLFDVFYFDVGQTGGVAVTVDNYAGSDGQLTLHYQAITANPLALDYTTADGLRVAAAGAAPGRYYIVMYAAMPGPPTPYTLRAEWN